MNAASSIGLFRLIAMAAATSLLLGCGGSTDDAVENAERAEDRIARSQVERGPVRVTVEVDPAKARLSDEPTLTLTIDYETGVTVQKPPFGESMGDFVIRDYREPMPKIDGNRETLRQIYTLEPTRTGELAIWPISVTFTDTRPDGDGKEHTIETEGLNVEIASVLDSQSPSLGDLRPMTGPVELKHSESNRIWGFVAFLVVVGGAVAVWYLRRRRRKRVEEVPLSPRELAFLELERILANNLVEEDVKLFYVELTGVVRRYIERTTGILAPEQTTEEFLHEISLKATFPAEESKRLKQFLESADLVKFAAHQPRKEDLEESFQRAKAFVGLDQTEVAA